LNKIYKGAADMTQYKRTIKRRTLPLLALRGIVIFPYTITTFDVGRPKSIKAIEEAMLQDNLIFLTAQKDLSVQDPEIDDIFKVGTIAKIKQILKLPGENVRVLIEGIKRAEIRKIISTDPFIKAEVIESNVVLSKRAVTEDEIEAAKRSLLESFENYVRLSNRVPTETLFAIATTKDADKITFEIAGSLPISLEQRQLLLDEQNVLERIEMLLGFLVKETEILQIEKKINAKVKNQIDSMQREYYLREQMKAIQKELGDTSDTQKEFDEYTKQMEGRNLPEEVVKTLKKEMDRLTKMSANSAESGVIRTYIETILELPWDKSTEEKIDLDKAEHILEEDHYGLEEVKTRILEYLAIKKLKNSLKGPILCLVGPPGVGKTSVAKSIARAINRNYVRISLGGIRDEAEIRGHRKTYIGAMPGRIIKALQQAGSNNPLILLDEVDKMSSDFRGDPSSAMLEVLDSEQNFSFRDHYLELQFDLSNVMFITTANNYQTIPEPLLDRMEVIEISSYTEIEKINIGMKFLLPKQLAANGLNKSEVRFSEKCMAIVVSNYTREAGVRQLERVIGKLLRKVAREKISNNKKVVTISCSNIEKYLGKKKYRYDEAEKQNEVGLVTGLAWTPVGGTTLNVEVTIMEGTGKIELTGQLGDIMKESAMAAISLVRSRMDLYRVEREFYKDKDIHIHVPEGATPKDGPSAGITMTTAVISALTKTKVKWNVAMTGEITLRGKVLPIGGLKEKVIAAARAGIMEVVIPEENKKDLDDIPETVRSKIVFHYAKDIDDVLRAAMENDGYLRK
jgi:ATP-dependent Lon protease